MKSLIRRSSGALSLEYILLTFDPNTYIQTIFFQYDPSYSRENSSIIYLRRKDKSGNLDDSTEQWRTSN